jgi:hypothetical protein
MGLGILYGVLVTAAAVAIVLGVIKESKKRRDGWTRNTYR